MKKTRVYLHHDLQRVIWVTAGFAMFSSLLLVITALIADAEISQLMILRNSGYLYSLSNEAPVGTDDYYKIDASIGFTTTEDSTIGLNADVLMQVSGSDYTSEVAWNAYHLDVYEVAVSHNLAKSHGISIGDSLYSKHTVDGLKHEYLVKQFLPSVLSTYSSKDGFFSDGIIIMGYDEKYIDNISHSTVIYTDLPLEHLAKDVLHPPIILAYRQDIIASIKKLLFQYLFALLAIAIIISVVHTWLLTRNIIYDYQRQIAIGFKKRDLICSYSCYIMKSYLISLWVVLIVSFVTSRLLLDSLFTGILCLLVIVIGELVIHVVSIIIWNRRIWRM